MNRGPYRSKETARRNSKVKEAARVLRHLQQLSGMWGAGATLLIEWVGLVVANHDRLLAGQPRLAGREAS